MKRKFYFAKKDTLNKANLSVENKNNAENKSSFENSEIDILPPETITLEMGNNLFSIIKKDMDSFFGELAYSRKNISNDLGFIVPQVKISCNELLNANECAINFYETQIYKKTIKQNEQTALCSADVIFEIINFFEITVRRNADKLLSVQDVYNLTEKVKAANPILVQELLQEVKYLQIKNILCLLLKEEISIRNLVYIFDTISSNIKIARDNNYMIAEKIRQTLGRQICMQYLDKDGILNVIPISHELSNFFIKHTRYDEYNKPFLEGIDKGTENCLRNSIYKKIRAQRKIQHSPVIVVSNILRIQVKDFVNKTLGTKNIPVISDKEIINAGTLHITVKGKINNNDIEKLCLETYDV